MAEKVKVKKAKKKISAGKVVGETIKFLACPPYKIGEWISDAVDNAAKKKAAENTMDQEKYEEVCKATGQMTAEELETKTAEVTEIKEPESKVEEEKKTE